MAGRHSVLAVCWLPLAVEEDGRNWGPEVVLGGKEAGVEVCAALHGGNHREGQLLLK